MGAAMLEAIQNGSEKSSLSRRALLCGALAISLGLAPDLAEATDAAGVTQSGGKLKISLAKNKSLAKVGGVVQVPLSDGSSLAIIRTTAATNGFIAMNLSCTHQGVTVQQQGTNWVCPAHGSEYTLAGKVVRGPARTALIKYPLSATSKVITVG